jgi:hypothetical protein
MAAYSPLRYISGHWPAISHLRKPIRTHVRVIAVSEKTGMEGPAPCLIRRPLPAGYRQGVISAITVILGFSLLFMRYWSFEAEGSWTASSTLAAALLSLSIVLQTFSLWRSLQVRDDDETEYTKTLRWFMAATAILLLSVFIAALSFSGLLPL